LFTVRGVSAALDRKSVSQRESAAITGLRRIALGMAMEGHLWHEIQACLQEHGASDAEARAAIRHVRVKALPRIARSTTDYDLRKKLAGELSRATHLYQACLRRGELTTAASVMRHLSDLRGVTGRLKAFYAKVEANGKGEVMGIDASDGRQLVAATAIMQLARLQAAAAERALTDEETRQLEQCGRTLLLAETDAQVLGTATPAELVERAEALTLRAKATPLKLLGGGA